MLRPSALALSLSLRVREPASYMRHQLPLLLGLLHEPMVAPEGRYLQLRDDQGAIVWETASAARIGIGSVRTGPDLEGCNPISHSQPVSMSTPACPAA